MIKELKVGILLVCMLIFIIASYGHIAPEPEVEQTKHICFELQEIDRDHSDVKYRVMAPILSEEEWRAIESYADRRLKELER